ncbi:hypothetical protein FB458_0997 [Lapillicoccus jejuensis]|uniref:Uncharacterized protein n=1 Tax=Lapillicoccus jejuensis TaxID=402171 RepID=A0A542DXX7_9MICO|nr:hypothetical protein FB458_0997 [Lapillicoccus jejuensis]
MLADEVRRVGRLSITLDVSGSSGYDALVNDH